MDNLDRGIERFTLFLEKITPWIVVINIIVGIILLVTGLFLLNKSKKNNRKKIGGIICVIFSIVAFIGAIFTGITGTPSIPFVIIL